MNELETRLCAEVPGRIARYHKSPNSISFSTEEMKDLTAAYPTAIILTALTNTGTVVRKTPTMERSRIVKAVQNICERLLVDGQLNGKHLDFRGRGIAVNIRKMEERKPVPKPVPQPARDIKQEVEQLLTAYQANIAGDGSWTMSNETAESLLKLYELKTLRAAMLGTPRCDDPEKDAQNSYDLLAWRCEQQTLTTA